MIACAWPNRALAARVPGNIEMNTAPDLTMATAIAERGRIQGLLGEARKPLEEMK